ncbi:uncharacterized protein MAM_04797 [Metarhizium album ARSEF 1941]|uniref:Fucose-specific lectin n=1 Tax=Metarhizium album (strain ARSEF 1941) TaxID=1081103 RepID=A0A0B2WWE5_METAS|nr:uncharacterized protein MAM_04797 [Metarhizium album ARSEF 1941]KHN97200.1 hypothetical protein MAM_04797 [Metarhizium album ARSEF 1941]
MATGSIPLEALGPPPEYENRLKRGVMGPIHNHYYTHDRELPWYRRKRVFYPAAGLLVLIVITCAVVVGVVLKLESARKSDTMEGDDISSTMAPLSRTGPISLGASAATSRGSTALASTAALSTRSTGHVPTPTAAEARETATPFTMSDKSQLASLLVGEGGSGQERRLLVLQEDTGHLYITEWTSRTVNHFRIHEKLGTSAPEPKPGTPLAMETDQTGLVHLFYLSQTNLISQVSETEAGRWKAAEVTDERGSIRTSSCSGLSTTWHRGKTGPDLLVLAFDNPSQELQLAVAESPADRGAWFTANVTSVLMDSVPGQSNMPCYALAGDWYDKRPVTKGEASPRILIGVVEENEVVPWDCTIDFWPPPDVQVRCGKTERAFADTKGDGLALSPVPRQLLWLRNSRRHDGQDDSADEHDFILLSADGSNLVRENLIGSGNARDTSSGFAAASPITAMSATSDGLVFLSLGRELQLYKKSGSRWENTRLQGLHDGLNG